MAHSRRGFLAGAAAAIGAVPFTAAASVQRKQTHSPQDVLSLFSGLPGDVSVKFHAPATGEKPEFLAELNPDKTLFVGSSIKTFVLCETLRQNDSPTVVQSLTRRQLDLDASVWSSDSQSFNPPNLIGKVSHRTALEAMIMHSDNTATDMCLKQAGPDKVRAFVASANLPSVTIPNSTRTFIGYLLGAKDYAGFTWEQLAAAANQSLVNPLLNRVESLAGSANDFVSYYRRALQGDFFQHPETLKEFRRILSLGDAIWLIPLPLGVSAFVKGGSADAPHFHALCGPGAMFFDDRWVYFCLTLNWYSEVETDPKTVAAFASAASRALAMVKDSLSAG